MRACSPIVLLAVAACGFETSSSPSDPAVGTAVDRRDPAPIAKLAVSWLPGFAATAVSDAATVEVDHLLGEPAPGCMTGDPGAHVLHADVAPHVGLETIVVSSANGLVILDGDGDRVAATELPCGGSSDEIDAVAIGRIAGVGKVIAVVAVTGGHRETTTTLELFHVDLARRGVELRRLVTVPIAARDGNTVTTATLELTPTGLHRRSADGRIRIWVYDPTTRAYFVQR